MLAACGPSAPVEELARRLAYRAQERLLIVYTIPYLSVLPSRAILYHLYLPSRTAHWSPYTVFTISRSCDLGICTVPRLCSQSPQPLIAISRRSSPSTTRSTLPSPSSPRLPLALTLH